MRRVSEKEIQAVLQLDGQSRFERLIKVVADSETAWGLWRDGWALFEDDAGMMVFPLWPAKEFAEACRLGDWANYEATPIPVDDLFSKLLPSLRQKSVLAGVFPTPSGQGVTVDGDVLERALRDELEKYG